MYMDILNTFSWIFIAYRLVKSTVVFFSAVEYYGKHYWKALSDSIVYFFFIW